MTTKRESPPSAAGPRDYDCRTCRADFKTKQEHIEAAHRHIWEIDERGIAWASAERDAWHEIVIGMRDGKIPTDLPVLELQPRWLQLAREKLGVVPLAPSSQDGKDAKRGAP